jgi:hypothetical protein
MQHLHAGPVIEGRSVQVVALVTVDIEVVAVGPGGGGELIADAATLIKPVGEGAIKADEVGAGDWDGFEAESAVGGVVGVIGVAVARVGAGDVSEVRWR